MICPKCGAELEPKKVRKITIEINDPGLKELLALKDKLLAATQKH